MVSEVWSIKPGAFEKRYAWNSITETVENTGHIWSTGSSIRRSKIEMIPYYETLCSAYCLAQTERQGESVH